MRILVLLATLTLAAPLGAHELAKGPNGGKVVDVAGHHLEFVPSVSEITIYATDEADKPIATEGSKGRAVIQNAGKTSQKDLKPVEPNKFVGKLDAPLIPGAVAVISITFSDGHAAQGRFTVD
ncbi:MAG: hypothetical protein NW215_03970 [Hyphomicrobiales bacterium]|nr:hypothetical protein [Hyphomicrobiales bacterium]